MTEPAVKRPLRVPALVALGATVVESLTLVGLSAFYVYEIAVGQAEDVARAVMSVVLMLVFAAGLAVVARGWRAGRDGARTPTLVWNALLLPVSWTLLTQPDAQAWARPAGVAVGVVALAGLAGAYAAGSGASDTDA